MKKTLVRILGYLICIAVPAVAVVDQFGYHAETLGWAALLPSSGLTLFLLVLCFKPILNWAVRQFKSDAAWKMWLIITVIMAAICKIGYPMVIVGAFGTVGNFIGGMMIRWANKEDKK